MHSIHTQLKRQKYPALLFVTAAMAIACGCSKAQAAVTLTSNVVFSSTSNLYTYSYSVLNSGTAVDLAEIDIPFVLTAVVANPIAPVGFFNIVDNAPTNIVSFLEDFDPSTPQTFAPNSLVSGFSFTSSTAPGFVTFSALDAEGNMFSGLTQAPVPEPSASLLGCVTGLLLTIRRRRSVV